MKYIKTAFLLIFCVLVLCSCGGGTRTLALVEGVSEKFAFKYGAVYSDEFGEWDVYYFSPELKKTVFGDNAEKYTYITSVSGYFSRDMVSGSELIAVGVSDRSHRAEVMALLYRRAALKLDMDARVFCEGNYVFLVCDNAAEQIIEYIRGKI